MTCVDLANTGTLPPWAAFAIALVLVLAGVALVLRTRESARASSALVALVCLAAVLLSAPITSAQATCVAPTNSLTIIQTSVNAGLSPTQAPSVISGRVTNNGPNEAYISAVTVTVSSVTKAPGAMPGTCDASDYIILDSRMPVNVELAAYGDTTEFGGARIGFHAKTSNQDACKGATVELLFVSG